jgi:hypothetical protein
MCVEEDVYELWRLSRGTWLDLIILTGFFSHWIIKVSVYLNEFWDLPTILSFSNVACVVEDSCMGTH